MLPVKEGFLELARTIVNASLCYDVWWTLQNAENQHRYGEIVDKYSAFFDANAGAQLVAMIVLLYQAYETRPDTQNFHSLLKRKESESNAKKFAVQVRCEIKGVMPIWKKIARARSTVMAHLSQKNPSAQLMKDANLTSNEIRDLIRTSKSILTRIAAQLEILDTAVLDMSAVRHTRQWMQAPGAK